VAEVDVMLYASGVSSQHIVRFKSCHSCARQEDAPDNCGNCGNEGSVKSVQLSQWIPKPNFVYDPLLTKEQKIIEAIDKLHANGRISLTYLKQDGTRGLTNIFTCLLKELEAIK
jgi:hypothetical protein